MLQFTDFIRIVCARLRACVRACVLLFFKGQKLPMCAISATTILFSNHDDDDSFNYILFNNSIMFIL